ncbi:hypothetical protein DCC39_07345 [Pueribacillus theae]|uniref:Uncharacterized protein n=1 Tax=Pueribacillus theae TaxID=2171751 RepID=A0A2U1K5P2_9BACI|nr:hypothetical protein [Pueribacillus theae]PWA12238.1 hypothetical protein DCC39_07345 [Pueribacillus theae]
MLSLIGILAVTAAIIAIDVPPLLKKKQKKELWAFFILLGFGVTLGILMSFEVNIPNPLEFIHWIFKPIISWIHNLLH